MVYLSEIITNGYLSVCLLHSLLLITLENCSLFFTCIQILTAAYLSFVNRLAYIGGYFISRYTYSPTDVANHQTKPCVQRIIFISIMLIFIIRFQNNQQWQLGQLLPSGSVIIRIASYNYSDHETSTHF